MFAGAGTNPGEKTLEDKFFEKEVSAYCALFCIACVMRKTRMRAHTQTHAHTHTHTHTCTHTHTHTHTHTRTHAHARTHTHTHTHTPSPTYRWRSMYVRSCSSSISVCSTHTCVSRSRRDATSCGSPSALPRDTDPRSITISPSSSHLPSFAYCKRHLHVCGHNQVIISVSKMFVCIYS